MKDDLLKEQPPQGKFAVTDAFDAPLADTEPPDESSAKKLVPLVEERFAEKIVNPVERCAKELEIEEAGNDQDPELTESDFCFADLSDMS